MTAAIVTLALALGGAVAWLIVVSRKAFADAGKVAELTAANKELAEGKQRAEEFARDTAAELTSATGRHVRENARLKEALTQSRNALIQNADAQMVRSLLERALRGEK